MWILEILVSFFLFNETPTEHRLEHRSGRHQHESMGTNLLSIFAHQKRDVCMGTQLQQQVSKSFVQGLQLLPTPLYIIFLAEELPAFLLFCTDPALT